MIYLQIDEVVHNVYENATDGYGVIECASLTCLSSPCQSYATCVEFGDSWNCLCPSGCVLKYRYLYKYITGAMKTTENSNYNCLYITIHFVYLMLT